jgi:FAD/FMN-containing dehydrogenase
MVLFAIAFAISVFSNGLSVSAVATPEGCRAISGDTNWPQSAVWTQELPGIVPRKYSYNSYHPNYRISANTVQDVKNAVKFAAKHKIRLSIINSGHDYMGRNDAPDGLWLDVSRLSGVHVLDSFAPTTQGAQAPDPSGKVNVITPKPGVQAAATLGAGLSAVELNKALKASKVFAVSGAARELFSDIQPSFEY